MTLAIAITTGDGLVLAADSRTSSGQSRVLSDFTHKVFKIGDVAVATYNWAFLLNRNIAGHVAELTRLIEKEPSGSCESPKQVAERLHSFMGERLEEHLAAELDPRPPNGQGVLGFLVAGYEGAAGRTYEVLLPDHPIADLHSSAEGGGAAWRGQTDVVVRLVKGRDIAALQLLAESTNKVSELEAIQTVLDGLEYIIPFGKMNLQDAIDFAALAIRTTIDVQRLTYGIAGFGGMGSWPGVGGPIEIAAVTATDGCRWVQRTELQGERPAGDAERI